MKHTYTLANQQGPKAQVILKSWGEDGTVREEHRHLTWQQELGWRDSKGFRYNLAPPDGEQSEPTASNVVPLKRRSGEYVHDATAVWLNRISPDSGQIKVHERGRLPRILLMRRVRGSIWECPILSNRRFRLRFLEPRKNVHSESQRMVR